MKIDIDKLTEKELTDLNNRIVERLKFLSQKRAHEKMLNFAIGEQVAFQPEGRPQVVGMLVRYNKKTVTIITEAGERWNVSPNFLRKVEDSQKFDSRESNVIQLKKK
jgi:hypothetical protein